MKNRRKYVVASISVISAWITPIVTSVSIPAHAQASFCTTGDFIGTWRFSIEGTPDFDLDLFSRGTTNQPTLFQWSFSGGVFILNEDAGDILYVSNVIIGCAIMSGTFDIIDVDSGSFVTSGVWSAFKV